MIRKKDDAVTARKRAYIKSKYAYIYTKGGNKIHIDIAPSKQVHAMHDDMMERSKRAAEKTKPIKRERQQMFKF